MDRPTIATCFAALLGVVVVACGGPTPTPGTTAVTAESTAVVQPSETVSPPAASPSPVLSSPSAAPAASLTLTPVPAPAGGLFERIRAAVQAAAGGATVDLTADVTAGSAQLDGTADDGDGPGRLLVVVSPAGTTSQTNLCLDRDFVQGGTCERDRLPDGGLLYRRGLVEFGNTRTIVVAIQRADGSGVLVESDNFTVPTPPVLVAGQPHPTPTITRDDPVFSLDELASLARAVSTATDGCTLARCP